MNVPQIGANLEISGYNSVKCTGDPAQDAQNFADANSITVDEAKKILSANFGEPASKQVADVAQTVTNSVDEETDVATVGSKIEIDGYECVDCTFDPEQDAKNFATANNITVDEAEQILSGKFGEPKEKLEIDNSDQADDDSKSGPEVGSLIQIDGYNSIYCTGDPAVDASNFAEANDISVDDAKEILMENLGEPSKD